MVFRKKTAEPKKEEPAKPTETISAHIITEDKSKLIEFLAEEFKETYTQIFGTKEMEDLDQDWMTMSLLFAIYGELRIQRMILEKQAKK